jgi:Zn-dependent protease
MGAGFSAPLVLAAIFGSHIAEQYNHGDLSAMFAVFAGFCAIFNLANLVPVWKFDGGQVLRQLFRQQGGLMVASATIFSCLFAVCIFAGISLRILFLIGAVFAVLSLLTGGSAAKPRHEIKPMTTVQQVSIVAGFFSVFAAHSGGVLWAVQCFFS